MAKRQVKLSDQVRKAVRDSGLTHYRIWKLTGIRQDTLSRFMRGERGLPMKTLDRLAAFLELEVVSRKRGKGW